jgi:hypothetical protein
LERADPAHEGWSYSVLTLYCPLKPGRYDAMHRQRRSCTLDSYRADLSSFPQHFFALTESFRNFGRHFVDRPFKVPLAVIRIRALIEAEAARHLSLVAQ